MSSIAVIAHSPSETLDASVPGSVHPRLAAILVDGEEQFLALRDDWNALAGRAHATIFQTHQWQHAWWKRFRRRSGQSLHIVLFYEERRLIGIAPFFLTSVRFAAIPCYKQLRFLGSGEAFFHSFGLFLDDGPSDYLDLIVEPGYELAVCESLLEYVRKEGNIDGLGLVNLRKDGPAERALRPLLEGRGLSYRVTDGEVCSSVAAPRTMNGYLQELGSSERRRFSQALNASQGSSALYAIVESRTREEIDRDLSNLIRLHQKRWNKLGYPGLFNDQRFLAFQRDVMSEFHDAGWLLSKSAWSTAGNTYIAGRMAFIFDGVVYDYLSGFDDEAPEARRRPGLAILLTMIGEMAGLGQRTLDLLRGDEQYKVELNGRQTYNCNMVVRLRATMPLVRQGLYTMARGAMFIRFLMSKEVTLFITHVREKGPVQGPAQYLIIRSQRFINKIRQ
jgi:CelD/BcsL family acetyltransferase involved in cellulose biosynthesis